MYETIRILIKNFEKLGGGGAFSLLILNGITTRQGEIKKIFMAEQKTKPTEKSVDDFLDTIPDEKVRADCHVLTRLMKKVTGHAPKMWGPAIIGFDQYHYKYESGREGDICLVGFSPRKQNLTLYVLAGFPGQDELLQKLGKHKTGKGCLYIKRLEDVDMKVLESMMRQSVDFMRKKHQAK